MGRNAEGLKAALTNITGLPIEGNTKGEIFDNFNRKFSETDVVLTFTIDVSGSPISDATIKLRAGEDIGIGTEVIAESNGTYIVHGGKYNYEVSKSGYVSEMGIVDITFDDIGTKVKSVAVSLEAEAL